MVMIAPSTEEHCPRIAGRDVEAKEAVIEDHGLLKVGHLKVNVSDARACGQSRPWARVARSLGQQIVEIQRIDGHAHLTAPPRPRRPGPVAIDLDAIAIWIREIER